MQAACALLRLYSSILLPVVVVSVWMFALYAALSYAVPTVLCSSAVRSSAVRHPFYHVALLLACMSHAGHKVP